LFACFKFLDLSDCLASSSLDFNPLNPSTLYDFCLHRVNVNWSELSGLWLYCYYWPQSTVGYGFKWTQSTKPMMTEKRPIDHAHSHKI
jgi:hypothetical protein